MTNDMIFLMEKIRLLITTFILYENEPQRDLDVGYPCGLRRRRRCIHSSEEYN
jgi:hypothetical protein